MTETEFNEAVKEIFRVENTGSTRIYLNYNVNNVTYRLKRKRLREAVELLGKLRTDQEFELLDNNSFEVSVVQNSRINFIGDDDICKTDTVNKIQYKLSTPSDTYLIHIIKQLLPLSNTVNAGKPNLWSRLYNRLKNRMSYIGENEELDFFDLLKRILPRFQTLLIKSESPKSKSDFETLTYSFLFNLSYNTDLSYLPSSFIEDLNRTIRIGRIRRARVEEIETPKRKYENDLILFYQKGISSKSVDLQYLSFYHILEHFFEKIYNDELIKSIKGELTKPSFSYKRNKDVSELIKIIQDKLKYKNDEFQINEPEALRLVLERFIPDLYEIKDEIDSYDSDLLNYYRSSEVEFSKGNKVNFQEDRSKVLKDLRERIYKTRNSIVHSKETDRERYLPFKHDKILQKEIMLMRVIAEKIIIQSSKEL